MAKPRLPWYIVDFFLVLAGCLAFFSNPAMALETSIVNSLGMEFVYIPPGTFSMGSPVDEPGRNPFEQQHPVSITRAIYIQTTEVTLKQWWSIMGKKFIGRRKGHPDMPVTRVSWYDAQDFILKLNQLETANYRLPSEAEWEYACRAGTTTTYFWGNTIDCTRAMYGNNSLDDGVCIQVFKSRKIRPDMPARVKSFPPNAWGLYDMHGNVWEWCMDCYIEVFPSGARCDPRVDTRGMAKVRRGGSWFKDATALRSANRAYGHASTRFQTTGFRLVMDLPR